MTQTVVITGANRGIGLEMARAWKARGDQVIAVCRQASAALKGLDTQIIEGIDVGRDQDMAALRNALEGVTIGALYNNAGTMSDETLDDMDYDRIRTQFEVNTLGPLRVTIALTGNLANGSKVGLMTSRMGSIDDNDSGGRYGYRISKAALNAAGKSLALDLKAKGVAVGIFHPGYVKTDMTGHTGHLTPEQSAERLLERMDQLNLDNTGTFWHSDGSVLPW
ncbi:SDR family oxidoreductase [Alloalcanivorax mobilis]|uniref:SDR family oxidoreductase n=1 Tax=Alloalcanivorax mobilis TaxID=2019569 RepID=UPI000C75B499|nr:SDR family oxidoreductase [Alloalcanivorax mobilis]